MLKLGTLGRLILGLLVNSPHPIKLVGDKSLSKRDFKRISDPLSKFGAKFKLKNNRNLPLTITGSEKLKPINYLEKKGSAQCKSSVIFAGMRTNGTTVIKAKKSRDHTEVLCKHLNLPISINKKKNYDYIKIRKINKIKKFDYEFHQISVQVLFYCACCSLKKLKINNKKRKHKPIKIGIIII